MQVLDIINWTPECQDAFDSLKQKLSLAPILPTPNMNKPFRIECDSSDFAAGAVLLQQDSNNNWKSLAFESKRYSKEERVYPVQEREMLAILIVLFIDGKTYTALSGHLPLKYYRDQKHLVPRLIRWMSEIELHNPDIQYKASKENILFPIYYLVVMALIVFLLMFQYNQNNYIMLLTLTVQMFLNILKVNQFNHSKKILFNIGPYFIFVMKPNSHKD